MHQRRGRRAKGVGGAQRASVHTDQHLRCMRNNRASVTSNGLRRPFKRHPPFGIDAHCAPKRTRCQHTGGGAPQSARSMSFMGGTPFVRYSRAATLSALGTGGLACGIAQGSEECSTCCTLAHMRLCARLSFAHGFELECLAHYDEKHGKRAGNGNHHRFDDPLDEALG